MTFASIEFLFYFLPLFILLYFTAKTIKLRNFIFVVFSLIFYAGGYTPHLFLLLFSIFVNYRVALLLDDKQGPDRRKVLVYGVAFNVLLLAGFKYTGFILQNLDILLEPFDVVIPVPRIGLPLGISFYSFHAISYIADIYKGRVRANRDPLQFILYMTMFPQLVAGPIVRYSTVARQLGARRTTWGRFSAGARIFAIGLAWKVLIADEVAPLVMSIFDGTTNPTLLGGMARGLCLRHPDLFRLRRLFRHGSGAGRDGGLHPAAQLPHSLRRPQPHGLLAPLAHEPVLVAARLCLYPARRQPAGRGAKPMPICGPFSCSAASGMGRAGISSSGAPITVPFWSSNGPGSNAGSIGRPAPWPISTPWSWCCLAGSGSAPKTFDGALDLFAGLFGLNGIGGLSFPLAFGLYPLSVAALVAGGLIGFWKWPRLRLSTRWRPVVAAGDYVMVAVVLLLSIIWIGGGPAAPFLYYRF